MRFTPLLALFVIFGSLSEASALHIIGTTGNLTAPGDDPGFANIGSVNGATAIYLGDRWVLTASHVGAGTVTLGGSSYAVAGPVTRLNNQGTPGMTADTDLILFQINGDPGLPSLTISPGAPVNGNEVVMVGAGGNRQVERAYYGVTQLTGPSNDIWTVAAGPGAGIESVYLGTPANGVRWGTNNIASVNQNIDAGSGSIRSFRTVFDEDAAGRPNEAQAVLGDSGSAVFRKSENEWQLLGMTHAVGNLSNYDNIPGGTTTSILGESVTFVADLSFYQDQILTIVPEPGSAALSLLGLLGLLHRRRPQVVMPDASSIPA